MWFEKGLPSRNLQPGSVASHDWARKIILDDIGHKRLKTLSPDDVEVMFRRRCDAGLSKSSLSKIRTTLRIALQWAERREIVFRNVATVSGLPPDAAPSPPLKSMTSEQVCAFLSASTDSHLDAMWRVMVFLGIRPGEAAGLSWDDVDFANQIIHIRRTLKRGAAGELYIGVPKTMQSVRSLDAPDEVFDALRIRKRIQNVERLAAGEVWTNEEGLVFTTSVGTPTDPAKNRKEFDQVVKEAGLAPEWSPNSLRHTAASLLSDAGVPLEVVADQLGHKDTRMASLHYRHRVRPTVSGGTTLGRLLANP
ncbi:tyrosine-type recombinase/integrase [Ilumatobacter sp.]|uniref:tyrosine-type recombinase/integrase n=1 Tax=Ilumatobacter sp. TaxID=1967498 RepID=UPI003C6FC0EB